MNKNVLGSIRSALDNGNMDLVDKLLEAATQEQGFSEPQERSTAPIIINDHTFSKLEDNLKNLSGAIDHISEQVGHICEGLPEGIKGQVDDLLNHKISGIIVTCHCLKTMAAGMGEEVSDWSFWAHKTNFSVDFKG